MQCGCVRLWKILLLKEFHVALEYVAIGDETCEFQVKPRIETMQHEFIIAATKEIHVHI